MSGLAALLDEHLKKSGLANPYTTQALPGGTNHVFLIRSDAQEFIVKIPQAATQPLVNRNSEYQANQLAAAAGISIPFWYFDLDSGISITRYQANSQILTPALMQQNLVWQACLQLLQRLHRLPQRFQRNTTIFTILDFYRQRAAEQLPVELVDLPAWDTWLVALRAEFSLMTIPSVPCHGDAMLSNFLLTDTQIYLIDWEYASNTDPCWDIATLADSAEFTPAQEQRFLNVYFNGALDTATIRRYRVYKVLADYLWALWCITIQDRRNAIYRWQRFQENAFHL